MVTCGMYLSRDPSGDALFLCTCRESVHMSLGTRVKLQPIPLGVSFSKAQSSKLERLFCHVSVKRDVRALSFEL